MSISQGDLLTVLEVARVGLAMVFDDIAEELDISDDELKRIQNDLLETLGRGNEDDDAEAQRIDDASWRA